MTLAVPQCVWLDLESRLEPGWFIERFDGCCYVGRADDPLVVVHHAGGALLGVGTIVQVDEIIRPDAYFDLVDPGSLDRLYEHLKSLGVPLCGIPD